MAFFKKTGGADKHKHLGHFPQSEVIEILELPSKKPVLTESFLKQKYVTEGLSSAEIASQVFSSKATVTRKLKMFGIELKSVTRRNNGKQVFGFRQSSGVAIKATGEQIIIKKIHELKNSGRSYNSISKELERMNIKSKKNNSTWYPKVVRDIYIRTSSHTHLTVSEKCIY